MPPPALDRYKLYEQSVQSPEAEIDFADRVYRKLRGRRARRLREDFCGTALISCEWARRRRTNMAIGLDRDGPTLHRARRNVERLPAAAAQRVTLLRRDVLHPGSGAGRMDLVLALNFSWWVFHTRPDLLAYFRAVRRSLGRGGVFILDIYGGFEAMDENVEHARIGGRKRGFTYTWDQARFDPISNRTLCHIHFKPWRTRPMRRAFTYDWRLWTIPETREALADAGFRKTVVYWEGGDGKGGGKGIFRPRSRGECCASFVAYIVALK